MPTTGRQYIISKRGALRTRAWSSRVLTFDPEHHCVYLSRKHHPEDLCHHRMHVTQIQSYTDYHPPKSDKHPVSDAVRRTFCVSGHHSVKEKTKTKKDDNLSSTVFSSLSGVSPFVEVHQLHRGTFTVDGEATWVLRCCSDQELSLVINSFRQLLVFHGAPEVVHREAIQHAVQMSSADVTSHPILSPA